MTDVNVTEKERLENLDVPSLKQICRNLGVRGYSGKTKAVIVTLVLNCTTSPLEKSLYEKPLRELRNICDSKGIIGASRKTKEEIVRMLATNPPSADQAVFNSEAEISMRANGWKRRRVQANQARLNDTDTPTASPTTTLTTEMEDDRMPSREMMISLLIIDDLKTVLTKFNSFNTHNLLDVVQSGEVIKEVDMIELSRLLMTVHGAVSV